MTQLKAQDIDLLIYDFDGVMTDNRAYVFEDGREAVAVNRGDGLGVNRIRSLGIEQMILSTETNPVVAARAKKLKLDVIHGCNDKAAAVQNILREKSLAPERVGFVGNDHNDIAAMRLVGVAIAPADATREILDFAHFVTTAKGGEGVIRELAFEIISELNG